VGAAAGAIALTSPELASGAGVCASPRRLTDIGEAARLASAELAHLALAPSTQVEYAAKMSTYLRFATTLSVAAFPVTRDLLVLYLQFLRGENRVHGASAASYVAAVLAESRRQCGQEPPTMQSLKVQLRGFARSTARPTPHRRQITVAEIMRVTAAGAAALLTLDWQTATACAAIVFAFAFFARASTVAGQRLEDVAQSDADTLRVTLTVEKGRSGAVRRRTLPWVRLRVLAGSSLAQMSHPWDLVADFIAARRAMASSSSLLFVQGRRDAVDVSALLRVALRAAAVLRSDAASCLLPHSCRKGAATAAIAFGVAEIAVRARGGWLSDKGADVYVRPAMREPGDAFFFSFLAAAVPVHPWSE
jgi:hypothetical protein